MPMAFFYPLILFFVVLDAVIAWDYARRARRKPLIQTKADAFKVLFARTEKK